MKFSVRGSKVVCRRIESSEEGEVLGDVVEFDAHVDAIPAHVANQLTKPERRELQRFLQDQERMLAKPEHRVILEALPALLNKVGGVLVSVEQIDEHLYQQLKTAHQCLGAALIEIAVKVREGHPKSQTYTESRK